MISPVLHMAAIMLTERRPFTSVTWFLRFFGTQPRFRWSVHRMTDSSMLMILNPLSSASMYRAAAYCLYITAGVIFWILVTGLIRRKVAPSLSLKYRASELLLTFRPQRMWSSVCISLNVSGWSALTRKSYRRDSALSWNF